MKMIRNAWVGLLFWTLPLGAAPLAAPEPDGAACWPEFHGPSRDNISRETGLLKTWPEEGPRLIWKYSGCGKGYSMVSLAGGRIFTAGDFGPEERVIALNLNGKLLWTSPNGESWNGPQPGSRTTPTYRDGALYHLNPTGRLAAYRARSGEQIWSVDLRAEFGARYGTWALAENVAVDGDRVLCVPGGSRGLVVALDKNSGKTIWACTDLEEEAAYCSGLVVTYEGVRQFITMTQRSVIGVDVATGKLLWSHPHVTPHDQNVTTPLFHEGYVLVTSGHSAGAALLRIDPDCRGVTEVWSDQGLDNCHGGVILKDGCLYGSGCRVGGKGFFCADFLTGRRKYTDNDLGKLSLTYAEGMLYGLSDRGETWLIGMTPEAFYVAGRFDLPRENRDPCYAHPVVCGGRLYLRHSNDLYAYEIRADAGPK